MEKYNLSFCDEFSYPTKIKTYLRDILDVLASDKVVSILLIGSTSRGELSYILNNDGEIKIFSDFEFVVITKTRVCANELKEIYDKIREIELSIGRISRLFHIDASFLSVNQLKRLPKKFQFYEARKAGIVIYGEDLRHLFPKDLDIKEINEVSLDKLWLPILYFPYSIFIGNTTKDELVEIKYTIARIALDIPVWLLAHNDHFIYGFKSRIDFIKKNYENLDFSEFLPLWFLDFLEECWKGKTRFEFKGNLVEMYEKVLTCYIQAIIYILSKLKLDEEKEGVDLKILKFSPHIFNEFIPRRKALELLLIAKNFGDINMKKACKWFMLNKKGIIVLFLFNMNLALLNYLKRKDTYKSYLEQAENCLFQLDFRIKEIKGNNFNENWLDLRKKYLEFLAFFYRSFFSKKDYLYNIIEQRARNG